MKLDRKMLTNLGLIVLAVAVVIGLQMVRGVSTVQAKAEKDCICHAAGPPPTQYICIHPSVNAVSENDQAGHLNEDATHGPEHAADFECDDCSECGPAPTPEPTPEPTPGT
jgi:hypothetical protein